MKKKQPTYGGKRRIRKDDLVVVLTGKDRGAQGKVLRVMPDKGRAIVEGVNKIKRATRAEPPEEHQGRHPRARGADRHLEPHARRPRGRQADARRHPQGGRRVGPLRQEERHDDRDAPGSGGAAMSARLSEKYRKEVVPVLKKEFGIDNPMAVPKVEKVVLNMGIGEAITNAKLVDAAAEELTRIAGQRAVVTKAKKSIATFKLRAGMPIGCRVTLRGDRMYEFLDRLMNVALPRVRDFRGVPTRAFDGRGNYTLGVKDHLIFPEIDPTKIDKSKGLNVTIVTTAGSDDRARVLLRELGMPFGR
jgi:large subunit ribosomal protein L5